MLISLTLFRSSLESISLTIGGKADAALAASVFHFKEIEIKDLKEELKRNNILVRL